MDNKKTMRHNFLPLTYDIVLNGKFYDVTFLCDFGIFKSGEIIPVLEYHHGTPHAHGIGFLCTEDGDRRQDYNVVPTRSGWDK